MGLTATAGAIDLGLHRAEVAVARLEELGRQAEVLWVYRRDVNGVIVQQNTYFSKIN